MIYDKKLFGKKLIDCDLNRKKLAAEIGMSANTLRLKIEHPDYDFKLKEAQAMGEILHLTVEEFFAIFFGAKLSLNESLSKTG